MIVWLAARFSELFGHDRIWRHARLHIVGKCDAGLAGRPGDVVLKWTKHNRSQSLVARPGQESTSPHLFRRRWCWTCLRKGAGIP